MQIVSYILCMSDVGIHHVRRNLFDGSQKDLVDEE
jgi:hypothetical protein